MKTTNPLRFLWRVARNLLCLTPTGRMLLFPVEKLAIDFGRDDSEYAWSVFSHHFAQLNEVRFRCVDRILEIGPGRNLGTALLWWALSSSQCQKPVEIVCWDVFRNADPEADGYWVELAKALLEKQPKVFWGEQEKILPQIQQRLCEVVQGREQPAISYRVESLEKLEAAINEIGISFKLLYSQAAIEHIWSIEAFWNVMDHLTAPGGWHSHRIDLADHGRRDTNYIEMLEWSRLGYWVTMRFVPGALNRWRACHHLDKLTDLGMNVIFMQRSQRDHLPIPLRRVSSAFQRLGEEELRTTALDVVAMKPGT
jgi:hypothetical protein